MLLDNTQAKCIGFVRKALGAKPFIILPGVNDIDDKLWVKEFSKDPTCKRKVEDKTWIVVLEKNPSEKEAQEKKQALELSAFEDSVAASIVGKTMKHATLGRWLEEESRPKVVRALNVQIEKVGPTEVIEKSSDKPKVVV